MAKTGYLYLMSNQKNGVIYIGVTSDLIKRAYEHREGLIDGFTKQYNAKKLVYFEIFDDIETAILYEKKLKNRNRNLKVSLIERTNPQWLDLYETLL